MLSLSHHPNRRTDLTQVTFTVVIHANDTPVSVRVWLKCQSSKPGCVGDSMSSFVWFRSIVADKSIETAD